MSHSPLSRSEIRDLASRRAGFKARSQSQLNYLNDEIDNALARLVGDCADAFVHNPVQVDVHKNHDLGALGAAIKLPAGVPVIINDRILEITNADGTPLTGTWSPATDGAWDGRMWLRVTTADRTYLIKSREWWSSGQLGGPNGGGPLGAQFYVSLEKPLPFDASTPITDVIIYQPYMFFPSDTTHLKDAGQDAGSYNNTITVLDAATANYRRFNSRSELESGAIRQIWRTLRFDMPTPVEAPLVYTREAGTWQAGNFPKVQASFCYTYVWGRKSYFSNGEAPRGIFDPLWESAPSPLQTFTMTQQTVQSLVLQATNIDAQLGFSHPTLAGTPWEGRSGLRIRFYVQITGLVDTASADPRFERVETSEKFVLLQEIEPTAQVGGKYACYEWNGTQIPDFERLLKASPGYFGYSMHPQPSEDKILDFDIRRAPNQLQDDSMVVHVQPEGKEALIRLICSGIHKSDGDVGRAQVAEQAYKDLAELILARYGNGGGYGIPRGMGDYHATQPEELITYG